MNSNDTPIHKSSAAIYGGAIPDYALGAVLWAEIRAYYRGLDHSEDDAIERYATRWDIDSGEIRGIVADELFPGEETAKKLGLEVTTIDGRCSECRHAATFRYYNLV